MEFVIVGSVINAVRITHGSRASLHRNEQLLRILSQVVIIQEQSIMAQFVSQRPRPVLTQVAIRIAVPVPHGTDMHLARPVGEIGCQRVGDDIADDAALARAGTQSVRSVYSDIRLQPILPIIIHFHPTQRRLPIRPVV